MSCALLPDLSQLLTPMSPMERATHVIATEKTLAKLLNLVGAKKVPADIAICSGLTLCPNKYVEEGKALLVHYEQGGEHFAHFRMPHIDFTLDISDLMVSPSTGEVKRRKRKTKPEEK